MYIPKHFAVDDPDILRGVIRDYPFATLITNSDDGPFATHVPLLLTESGEELEGHMARANPHWKLFDGRSALAIFHGPHAYVSPSWYESSPNVPTWNYIAVHVYGKPVLREDAESEALLQRTLATYDPGLELDDAGQEYFRKIMPGVVSFQIPIERIQGKFKLNQNKQQADRDKVISILEASEDSSAQQVAAAMRTQRNARKP